MRVIILALLLCCLLAEEGRSFSPFEVLNLPVGASKQEIRKAFKELSLQYHPDINPAARKRYERIIEAYQILKKEDSEPAPSHYERFPQGQPSYVDLEDLLNKIELEMRQGEQGEAENKEISFVRWCLEKPKIIVAALLISYGILAMCK